MIRIRNTAEMVDILWRIFGKNGKKFKMKSQDRKTSENFAETFKKLCFFGFVTFNFFEFFSKNAPDYIDPSSHFVFYEIFVPQISITPFFSSIVGKLKNSAIYESITLIFSLNLPLVFISKKEIQMQQPGKPREQYI